MKKVKLILSGKYPDGNYWHIVQHEIKGEIKHTVVSAVRNFDTEFIEIPEVIYKSLIWAKSGTKKEKKASEIGYSKNKIFSFGMYKGYELGIVYAFDAYYLEWCISNVESFFINDIEELYRIGIFYTPSNRYQAYREIRIPNINPFIDVFKTIDELRENVPILNNSFRFSEKVVELNRNKMHELVF